MTYELYSNFEFVCISNRVDFFYTTFGPRALVRIWVINCSLSLYVVIPSVAETIASKRRVKLFFCIFTFS